MKKIFVLTIIFLFFFLPSGQAEDIYVYKNRNGITVITNRPIPEKYKSKARKIDSFKNEGQPDKPSRLKTQASSSPKGYHPKIVEKEKKRLEAEIKRLKRRESEDSQRAPYYRFYIDSYEKSLHFLERDPEGYFKKQHDLGKEATGILRGRSKSDKP